MLLSSHPIGTNLLVTDGLNIRKDGPFNNLITVRGGQDSHVAEEFQVLDLLGEESAEGQFTSSGSFRLGQVLNLGHQ